MNIANFGFARARRMGRCLRCSCADVVNEKFPEIFPEICMSRTRKTFRKLRSPNRETRAKGNGVIGPSAIAVRSARIGVLARVLYGTRLELEGVQGAVGKVSLSTA